MKQECDGVEEQMEIYISTYGKKAYRVGNRKIRIPIEVGAACRNKDHKCKYSVRDDSGINMSDENPYYGELTAMYWIWKNTDSIMVS